MEGSLVLHIAPVTEFVTGVAFALAAAGSFLLARRYHLRPIAVSTVAFAYCSVSLLLYVALFFLLFRHGEHPYRHITDTWWFYWLVNGARPYVLLVGSAGLLLAGWSVRTARGGA